VNPLSPKRQVTNLSLKSYADSLFQFTQDKLTHTAPQLMVEPLQLSPEKSPQTSQQSQEPASVVETPPHRPLLASKFSEWSIATGAQSSSQADSLAHTPIELDQALLSPDSFFGTDVTPKRKEFDFNRLSGFSFASSETYEPQSIFAPSTPPSAVPDFGDSEEISYFTNYDMYLDPPQREDWPLPPGHTPPDSVAIEISPLETKSPETPPPPAPPTCHERTNTVVRRPVYSAPLMHSNAPPFAAYPSPSTPFEIADVAIRVPHWLIGAIG
jgi:hypothetical protein